MFKYWCIRSLQKTGFEVVHEIDYYMDAKSKLAINKKLHDAYLRIKETNNPEWDLLKNFRDFEPSWQNTINSIKRKFDYFRIFIIYKHSCRLRNNRN